MGKSKRTDFTDKQIRDAYLKANSLRDLAEALNVSYPTAVTWAQELGFAERRQGYNPPKLPITGLQCRHAREYLCMTRDQFCERSGVGKTALREFELGNKLVREASMSKILSLFELYNIEFKEDGTFFERGKYSLVFRICEISLMKFMVQNG